MTSKSTDVFFITEVIIFVFTCFPILKPCICHENGIKISLVLPGVNFGENHFDSKLLNRKRVKPVLNTRRECMIFMLWDIESCPGPALFRNAIDFTILHQNVCGIASEKDILEDFILEKNIEIFGVIETLLQNTTPTSLVDIRGYTFERNDRSSKGGGVGVYIKENIEYIHRNDLNDENVEAVWIKILQNNSKSCILGVLYRPPLSLNHLSKNFESIFMKIIDQVNSGNKEVIIIGDLNISYLKNDDHRNLNDNIVLLGLNQIVNKPTRVTKDSNSLIDIILTNRPGNLCSVK